MSADVIPLTPRQRRGRKRSAPPDEASGSFGRRVLRAMIAIYGLAQVKSWLEQETESLR
jgi:hypothetical protein